MCLYYCQEQNENKQRTFRENNQEPATARLIYIDNAQENVKFLARLFFPNV